MDGGSVVHLAHMNYLCEAAVGQWVWACLCVIPPHATIWTVSQTPKYHTIGCARSRGARLAVVFLFLLWYSTACSEQFHLEAKICFMLWLKVR